ncbi:amidohydrolase family protein [Paraburkholderia sp. J41]|uniref:metal-dependent hydrolase family protein n=1 Tax=Paraburkholderia sp. J41 TaxID=2805433 RepID=UPI002AC335EA|nr:amidohydrolase family protein [Paraburkholderia sp. J41]
MSSAFELKGATVVDGTGAAPLADATVRVRDGCIEAVWSGAVPSDAARLPVEQVIDVRGMTVMPGLIDAHCHISYGEGRTAEEVDVYGGAEWAAVRAVWNARKVLLGGVTSFCDPGSTWNVAVTCRDAIDSGMYPGPRIFAGGRHLSADGGFADYFPSWLGMPPSAEGVLCPTRDEIGREVRRQVKNRVDLIKISGDSQAQERAPNAGSCFTDDELQYTVRLAHQFARKVTVHSRYAETVLAAARAGVDWLIHASYMRAGDISEILDLQVPICPTITFTANVVEHGRDVGVDEGYIETKRRELDALVSVLTRALEAGIPMMMGSESGFSITPYGEWHVRELELMVKLLGMSPMDAIVASTSNNARAFGWAGRVGTIEPGCRADLLVVDGDPLADISLLGDRTRINAIFKDGEKVEVTHSDTRRRMAHERGFSVSREVLHRRAGLSLR